jgi:agmatinase
MGHPYLQRSFGFLGAGEDYEKAEAVLVGLPMDYTVSLRPGARFGPQQIRNLSIGLETYSPYQDKSLDDLVYYDAGDVELPFGNTAASLVRMEEVAGKIFAAKKFPLFLGGEHLVSLPLIKACAQCFSELVVFHFDAHTDLREEFYGEENSHATVMRKVVDFLGKKRLYQFGIRSGLKEEFEFARENTHLYLDEIFPALEQAVKEVKGKPVYLTLDIDVLDPAFAPGTGTPEPGGCSSREIFQAILAMKNLNVVGMDLVEVAPVYDQSERTAILAAKLVREALLAFVR